MISEIVEKLNNAVSHSPLEEAHVQHIFTLARKLIKKVTSTDRNKYSLLNFYCNWTMHTEIDESEEGALVLARIHRIILDQLKKSDNSSMADDITAALSFEQLRTELNALISACGGNHETFSQTKWDEIIPILAEIISQCPLKIGKKKYLSKIAQTIKSQPIKGTSVVEELSIIKVSSITFNPNASADEITYCFCIATTDTTKFVTPIMRVHS